MVEESLDQNTHTHAHTVDTRRHFTFLTFQQWKGVMEGGSGSDRPLIPADPLIKDKIFESTDSPFLMTTPSLLQEEGLLLGENNVP